MIVVYPSSQFRKSFKKLPRAVQKKAERRDEMFRESPFIPILETHKLGGKLKDYWAYSVDEHYRVLFRFEKGNKVLYFDIGTHEIYK